MMTKQFRENKQLQQKFCKLSNAFLSEPVPESVWENKLPVSLVIKWITLHKTDNTCNLSAIEVMHLIEDVTMLAYEMDKKDSQ